MNQMHPPPPSASGGAGGWSRQQPLSRPPTSASSAPAATATGPSFNHPSADFAPPPQIAMYNPASTATAQNGPEFHTVPPAAAAAAAQAETAAVPPPPAAGTHDEHHAYYEQYQQPQVTVDEQQQPQYDQQQYDQQAYADYYAQQQGGQQQQGVHSQQGDQQQQVEQQQQAYGDNYGQQQQQQQGYYDQNGCYNEWSQQQQPQYVDGQQQVEDQAAVVEDVAALNADQNFLPEPTQSPEEGAFYHQPNAPADAMEGGGQQQQTFFQPDPMQQHAAFSQPKLQQEQMGEPDKPPADDRPLSAAAAAPDSPLQMYRPQQPASREPSLPPPPASAAANNTAPPDVARDSSTKQPPDILLLSNQFVHTNADRNLFMQTGQLNDEQAAMAAAVQPHMLIPHPDQVREPVDGGNEEAAAAVMPLSVTASLDGREEEESTDVDIPLDRLVLGQNSEQQQPLQQHLQLHPPPPPVQERVVPGEQLQNRMLPAPPIASSSPIRPPTAPPTALSTPTLPAMHHQQRSETVGSDRRDESVMGPAQATGPDKAMEGVRREVTTGADQAEAAAAAAAAATNESDVVDPVEEDENGQDSDDQSRTSSSRHQQKREIKQKPKRAGKNGGSGGKHRRRSGSSDGDVSSSEHDRRRRGGGGNRRDPSPPRRLSDRGSEGRRSKKKEKGDRHYDDRDRHHDDQDRHGRSHRDDRYDREKSFRGDERSYRDERSFRDDRSFYGEESMMNQSSRRFDSSRRNYDGAAERSFYKEGSRPSSRSGSVYDGHHGGGRSGGGAGGRGPGVGDYRERYARDYVMQHQYYPYHQQPQAAAAYPTAATMLPDRAAMETFEKHWRYYMQHPQLYEQMRTTNPAQYESLNNYYKMCGEYLRLPPIQPVPAAAATTTEAPEKNQDRPSSRASVHSGQSETAASIVANAIMPADSHLNNQQGDESAIFTDPGADPRYQPTFNEPSGKFGEEESELDNMQEYIPPGDNVVRRMTPAKFGSAHVKAVFGVMGNFARVDGKNPVLDGQSASVSMHSLQTMLAELPEAKEMAAFPGPLVPGRTHKGEVIQFCQAKIAVSASNDAIFDKESYNLVWELLILLLRQKNAIDGSDIAELLLKDREDVHRPYATKAQERESSLPPDDASGENVVVKHDRSVIVDSDLDKITMKFRDYLLYGHKKEGLEYAMKHGLWGHALFLASKMDERSYSSVMLRFANGLAVNDPMQTLYQLMSSRQPVAVKECADKNWGDWRPHLAMILSNPTGREELYRKSITQLGDTLMEKGLLHAAHFCHLMSNTQFGSRTDSNVKMVLIGSDHRRANLTYDSFATNEAVQCTEVFEYAQRLSNPDHTMMPFQHFKFAYAIRLLDLGMTSSALYYCEQIASALVRRPAEVIGSDLMDSATFVNQVLTLSDRLKYLDPSYTTRDGEISDMSDPDWLVAFKNAVPTMGQEVDYTNYGDGYYYEGEYYQNEQQPAADGQGDYNYDQEQQEQYQQEEEQQEINQNGVQQASTPDYGGSAPPSMMNTIPEEKASTGSPTHDAAPPPMFMNPNAGSPPMSQGPPSLPPLSMPTGQEPGPSSATLTSSHQSPKKETPPPAGGGGYFANIQNRRKSSTTAPPVPPPTTAQPPTTAPAAAPANVTKPEQKPSKKSKGDNAAKKASGPGLFGRLLGTIGLLAPNQMHLPKDSEDTIVWDEENKRWIDKNADEDESANGPVAPPSDMELSRNNSSADMAAAGGPPVMNNHAAPPGGPTGLMPPSAAPPGGNKFVGGLGKRRGLSGRIDVFKQSQSEPSLAPQVGGAPLPPSMLPPMPGPMMAPFEPAPASNGQNSAANGPISMDVPPAANDVAAPAPAAADQPMVFFNPNQFSAGSASGSTKRNLYT